MVSGLAVRRCLKFLINPSVCRGNTSCVRRGGLATIYIIITPGCTGGHNCQDPSDLAIQPRIYSKWWKLLQCCFCHNLNCHNQKPKLGLTIMTPGKARGMKWKYGLRAPKAAIQKIVSPPSGLWGTYLSFTPSCTGGHNWINPSGLASRETVLLRIGIKWVLIK